MDLSNFKPLWNINLPTSKREAVEQCRKIVKLGGKRPIKLEVLDQGHRWTINPEVVEAARILIHEDKFEIWPLITPDLETFLTLEKMGCPLIRMMGSAISSCNGINQEYIDVMKEIVKIKKVKIMMDGGIGGKEDVLNALELGFDYVLVNSCLFLNNKSPVQMLKSIVESIS
jgi:thiazole synthase ThiGH ThiG subunit